MRATVGAVPWSFVSHRLMSSVGQVIHLPPPFPSPPHGEGRSSTCPTDLNMETLSDPGSLYAGYDVGRKRDLSVLVVLERLNEGYRWRGAVELRQSPFDEQFELLTSVLKVPGLRRLEIDQSGLGMQLAEQLARDHGPTLLYGRA